MKHLKSFKIFELHSDTYRSAAEKSISKGDKQRAMKFITHLLGIGELDPALPQYLETALWVDAPVERFVEVDSEHPDDFEPPLTEDQIEEISNKTFGIEDFTPETYLQADKDLKEFRQRAGELLNGVDDSTIGHNFYLSRNRHGSGFFDTSEIDDEEVKEALQDIATEFNDYMMVHMTDGFNKIEIA